MQSQKAPQIIVIPHNLLQQQKSLLKISPSQAPISPYRVITTAQPTLNRTILSSSMNNSSHLTLNRAVLSPSLPIPSLRTVQPSVVRPVAAVVGSKRPAPSFSPTFGGELIKLEVDGEDESQPIRKRANLDHLSQEERLMRRKLKNRVAAQTARDKKKAQTDDMEKLISQMKEEQNSVLEANERLQAVNNQLQVENAALQRENTQLKSRMGPTTVGLRTDNVLELDLPPSPVSLPPTSPHPHSSLLSPTLSISSPLLASASPTLQPSESAAGAGLQMLGQVEEVFPIPPSAPRVVVERLDSLGGPDQGGPGGLSGSGLVCSVVPDQSQSVLVLPPSDLLSHTFYSHQSAPEKERPEQTPLLDPGHFLNSPAPRVSNSRLSLDTSSSTNTIFDELEPLLDTPTAEKILDNFLAGAEEVNMIMQGGEMDDSKWAHSLDDLFPELD